MPIKSPIKTLLLIGVLIFAQTIIKAATSVTEATQSSTGKLPVIVEQPINRTLPEGADVWITVRAESESPLTYQWQRGSRDALSGEIREGSFRDLDNGFATTPSLWLGKAVSSLNGYYRVRVQNAHGETLSRIVRVIVQEEDSKINRSFYPLVTVKGATANFQSGTQGWFNDVRMENYRIETDPQIIHSELFGRNVVSSRSVVSDPKMEVESLTSYDRKEDGVAYYGGRHVASGLDGDGTFLSRFDDTEGIFSITRNDGFPNFRRYDPFGDIITVETSATDYGEPVWEPYIFYPNVVQLGKVYSKTNVVLDESRQYNNETQFGNIEHFPFLYMDTVSKHKDVVRFACFLDVIDDVEPSIKENISGHLDGKTVTALVIVTERQRLSGSDELTTVMKDGTKQVSTTDSSDVSGTTIEWRVKGVGLSRAVALVGLHLDDIINRQLFDIELNGTTVIGGEFEDWIANRFVAGETLRIAGNSWPPFIGLDKLDHDVEVIDGQVSLFGFDEVYIPPDEPPVLSGGEDVLVTEPTTINYTFSAFDPNHMQDVEFRIWKNSGLSPQIGKESGRFTLTIDASIPDGEYPVTIRAKEVGPYSLETFKTFNVTVAMGTGGGGEVPLVSLVNGGFEEQEVTAGNASQFLPNQAGDWVGDRSVIVGAENGITPTEGSSMLKFLTTKPEGQSGHDYWSIVYQIIDLRGIRDRVIAGDAFIKIRGAVNRLDGGEDDLDTSFLLGLSTYQGDPGSFSFNTQFAELSGGSVSLLSDANSETWERLSLGLPLPSNAEMAVLRIAAGENQTSDPSPNIFSGHYIDDLTMELVTFSEAVEAVLGEPGFSWRSGGAEGWVVQSASDMDGQEVVATSSMNPGEQNWIEAQVSGPGELSFGWRSYSFDGLISAAVLIDGQVALELPVAREPSRQSVAIPEGEHAVRWVVDRDESARFNLTSGVGRMSELNFVPGGMQLSLTSLESLSVAVGATAIFTIGVAGAIDPTYIWYHDGSVIQGESGPTLSLTDVAENNAGNYFVRVSSGDQSLLSNVAALTVITPEVPSIDPPVILTQPSDQSVLQGEDAVLSVTVQSVHPVTYQWYFNGNEMPGEVGSSLGLSELDSERAGEYWVVVSNDGGSVNSRSALLSVITPVEPPVDTPKSGMVLIADDGPVGIGGDNANLVPTVIESFQMDIYEVTKGLWDQVREWGVLHGYTDLAEGWVGVEAEGLRPVASVNLFDAMKWCNARSEMDGIKPAYYENSAKTEVYRTGDRVFVHLNKESGYRLPSEAEWEKAARGGQYENSQKTRGYKYPWGTNSITVEQANFGGFRESSTQVGSYPPNAYGLYDMVGNVWEWCVTINQSGSTFERNYRGGSFGDSDERCSVTGKPFGENAPARTNAGGTIGFRTILPANQIPAENEFHTSITRSIEDHRITVTLIPAENVQVVAVEETLPEGIQVIDITGEGVWDSRNRKIKWGPFFDNTPRVLSYVLDLADGYSGTVDFSGVASIDGRDVTIIGDLSMEIVEQGTSQLSIVTQPIGGEAALGESFAFSVSMAGNVHGYQWLKDGQPVAGATLPFLVLPAVSASDYGDYQVIVSGPDGTVVSEVATLAELIDTPAGPVIDLKSISFLEIGNTRNMTLSISSEPSKTYQIMIRDSLSGDAWVPVGPQQIASKESLTFLLDVTGKNAAFFIATEVE